MKLKRRALLAAASVVLVARSREVLAQSGQEVRIGLILSATGGLASAIPPIRAAAQLAAEEINAAGGLLQGYKMMLVEVDDETNPLVGVTVARRLVEEDKVAAVIGPLTSGVVIPVAETVTIPAKVLLITPSATAQEISKLSRNNLVFRTVGTDHVQGRVLAQKAFERGIDRVAIMAINNVYGRGLGSTFSEYFKGLGGAVTSLTYFEENQQSYEAELATAAGKGQPQALLLLAYPLSGGITILREALTRGYFKRFIMSDSMRDQSVVQAVGGRNLAGSFGTAAGATAKTAQLAKYTGLFKSRYRDLDPLSDTAPQMYDAVICLGLGIIRAQSVARGSIGQAVREISGPPGTKVSPGEFSKGRALLMSGEKVDYEGASGALDFNASGDAVGSIEVWEVVGERITTRETITR